MCASKVIEINPTEALLKRRLRKHLSSLGFSRGPNGNLSISDNSKAAIRILHAPQRAEILQAQTSFIERKLPTLERFFASGNEVNPEKIQVRIERIDSNTWQGDLFRLASLTWAVPVSSGFGRRLRFLVWDEQNGKLVGILAIGDPVFNLSVRDQFIGWSGDERGSRLVNVMDAYVLGALPPYNKLLCGKLVACLIRSVEVYEQFRKQYGSTTGIISGESKNAHLLAVTTSSSMGRSSVYNRLKLGGVDYMKSIGFSGGWGHFHVPDELFDDLRNYLRLCGHEYADFHSFGQGPNWRIRVIRAALASLGFRGDMLKHGVKREVFISLLAENSCKILQEGRGKPEIKNLLSVKQIVEAASDRWIVPRAIRISEYKDWTSNSISGLIKANYVLHSADFKNHSSNNSESNT